MTMVLGWIFFSVAAGMFAHHRRNRNGIVWGAVALVATPLVAFVLLAILPIAPPRPVYTYVPAEPQTLQAIPHVKRRPLERVVQTVFGTIVAVLLGGAALIFVFG